MGKSGGWLRVGRDKKWTDVELWKNAYMLTLRRISTKDKCNLRLCYLFHEAFPPIPPQGTVTREAPGNMVLEGELPRTPAIIKANGKLP